jgi:hypothetical protein
MEKSKQLVAEFPCVTAILAKIHSHELSDTIIESDIFVSIIRKIKARKIKTSDVEDYRM